MNNFENKNTPDDQPEDLTAQELESLSILDLEMRIEQEQGRLQEIFKRFQNNEIGYDQKKLESDKISFKIKDLEAQKDKLLGVEKQPRKAISIMGRLAVWLTSKQD